jgi:aryl-alcohol dehydrogenase-like predicted oxidoreductase
MKLPSTLAFGCMSLSETKRDASLQTVARAYELGIRVFDNADIYPRGNPYGESESLLGDALRQTGVPRESVVLTSKSGICLPAGMPEYTYKAYDNSAAYLKRQVEGALTRLQTDYIDIWFIHRIDYLTHPSEIAETVDTLKQEGKIRALGASNYTVDELRALQAHTPVDAVQVGFSLFNTTPLRNGVHAFCTQTGIPLLAYSPLAGGALAGRPASHQDWRQQRQLGALRQIAAIASQYDTTPSVLALAWLMQLPGPVLPLAGSANPDHIAEAAGAVSLRIRRDHWYELYAIGLGHSLPLGDRTITENVEI